jgi:glycosyltransferase involved in cell wall biosynthesis
VDAFAANSHHIAQRLRKVYRRRARVVHPPVDVDRFTLRKEKEPFFLAASRMVPYKRMPLIVEAFRSLPDHELIVIGHGPELGRVRRAAGPNVHILGYQPHDVLRDHMQRARALVFAAEEDFGITPVEAQACGTPVIAFGQGGVTESVVDGVTGMLFDAQTTDAIAAAVARFDREHDRFDPVLIRAHAEQFSAPRFRARFADFVLQEWEKHTRRTARPRRSADRHRGAATARVPQPNGPSRPPPSPATAADGQHPSASPTQH